MTFRILPFRLRATPPSDGRPRTRVLVVDDEESIRSFVERVLQEAGYETVTAAGGEEAQRIASAAERFDLLVTDENMPDVPGHQLARLLRAREGGLKVLYLTGFSDQLFKEKQSLWEDEAFLDKPCSIKGLLEAVALLMSGGVALEK